MDMLRWTQVTNILETMIEQQTSLSHIVTIRKSETTMTTTSAIATETKLAPNDSPLPISSVCRSCLPETHS